MKTKLTALGLVPALAAVVFCTGAVGAEPKPPAVGQTTEFDCTGPYGKKNVFVVAEVTEERVRIEQQRDGREEWLEKPAAAIGLNIYFEQQRNDGLGLHKQTFKAEDLAAYAKLEAGSSHKFKVRERNAKGKWNWTYRITVAEAKRIDHPVLGTIEVVPILEKRTIFGGLYSSKMEALVYPEKGLAVSWTYKDRKGTSTCELVKID